MRRVLAGHVEHGGVPGLVSLVSRRGETHVDVLGALSLDGGEAMRRDAIFRIASLTKPVTAAAAMILVEECRLRLDDPVDPHLPELAGRRVLSSIGAEVDDTVPAARPITLRDLLTFRLGLGHVMAMPGTYPVQAALKEQGLLQGPPQPRSTPGVDEWIARAGSLPLVFQPGHAWMYDLGSDVLGVLVARASGQPLDVFLQERIFGPLGMNDTAFHVPPEKIDRLATSYSVDFATGALQVYDPAEDSQWTRPPAFPSGSGGLVSTADDYLAFAQMLMNGGTLDGERILSRPSVELMTADHITPAQKAASPWIPGWFDSNGWGFGMAVVTRREGARSVGTYGWDGGLGTTWYNDPREEMVMILFTQRAMTSPVLPPVFQDFHTSAYQALDD
jgi:CubicO group peptidase (beta-lactamase class C family)